MRHCSASSCTVLTTCRRRTRHYLAVCSTLGGVINRQFDSPSKTCCGIDSLCCHIPGDIVTLGNLDMPYYGEIQGQS